MGGPLHNLLGTIWRGARPVLSGIADLVLPRVCPACGQADAAGDGLCADCGLKLLAQVAGVYCPRCGSTAVPEDGKTGCHLCPPYPPRFGRVVRLGTYEGPLKGIIRQFKYRREEGLGRRFGRMLASAVQARCADVPPDLVMPVPAHWRRRLARAFDHSRALALAVADGLDLPLGDELARVRNTPPQANLPRSQRAANVRGAFEARASKAIAGATVLLVDDVTTTGATANEATRALLAAGASKVILAVIAKAQPPAAYAQMDQ
ncbi:MAG: ComF family protein [Phycisphaerae bacterium]